jgi:hypothetical protein
MRNKSDRPEFLVFDVLLRRLPIITSLSILLALSVCRFAHAGWGEQIGRVAGAAVAGVVLEKAGEAINEAGEGDQTKEEVESSDRASSPVLTKWQTLTIELECAHVFTCPGDSYDSFRECPCELTGKSERRLGRIDDSMLRSYHLCLKERKEYEEQQRRKARRAEEEAGEKARSEQALTDRIFQIAKENNTKYDKETHTIGDLLMKCKHGSIDPNDYISYLFLEGGFKIKYQESREPVWSLEAQVGEYVIYRIIHQPWMTDFVHPDFWETRFAVKKEQNKFYPSGQRIKIGSAFKLVGFDTFSDMLGQEVRLLVFEDLNLNLLAETAKLTAGLGARD